MPTKERTRAAVWEGLKKLVGAGIEIQFCDKETEQLVEGDIRAAQVAGDFYLTPRRPEQGIGFGFHYQDVRRKKDGLTLNAMSSVSTPSYATLSDQTTYYFCKEPSDVRDESVRKDLAKGHIFEVSSLKRLYHP